MALTLPIQSLQTANRSGSHQSADLRAQLNEGKTLSGNVREVTQDPSRPNLFRIKVDVQNQLMELVTSRPLSTGAQINLNRSPDGGLQLTLENQPAKAQAQATSSNSAQGTTQPAPHTSTGTSNTLALKIPMDAQTSDMLNRTLPLNQPQTGRVLPNVIPRQTNALQNPVTTPSSANTQSQTSTLGATNTQSTAISGQNAARVINASAVTELTQAIPPRQPTAPGTTIPSSTRNQANPAAGAQLPSSQSPLAANSNQGQGAQGSLSSPPQPPPPGGAASNQSKPPSGQTTSAGAGDQTNAVKSQTSTTGNSTANSAPVANSRAASGSPPHVSGSPTAPPVTGQASTGSTAPQLQTRTEQPPVQSQPTKPSTGQPANTATPTPAQGPYNVPHSSGPRTQSGQSQTPPQVRTGPTVSESKRGLASYNQLSNQTSRPEQIQPAPNKTSGLTLSRQGGNEQPQQATPTSSQLRAAVTPSSTTQPPQGSAQRQNDATLERSTSTNQQTAPQQQGTQRGAEVSNPQLPAGRTINTPQPAQQAPASTQGQGQGQIAEANTRTATTPAAKHEAPSTASPDTARINPHPAGRTSTGAVALPAQAGQPPSQTPPPPASGQTPGSTAAQPAARGSADTNPVGGTQTTASPTTNQISSAPQATAARGNSQPAQTAGGNTPLESRPTPPSPPGQAPVPPTTNQATANINQGNSHTPGAIVVSQAAPPPAPGAPAATTQSSTQPAPGTQTPAAPTPASGAPPQTSAATPSPTGALQAGALQGGATEPPPGAARPSLQAPQPQAASVPAPSNTGPGPTPVQTDRGNSHPVPPPPAAVVSDSRAQQPAPSTSVRDGATSGAATASTQSRPGAAPVQISVNGQRIELISQRPLQAGLNVQLTRTDSSTVQMSVQPPSVDSASRSRLHEGLQQVLKDNLPQQLPMGEALNQMRQLSTGARQGDALGQVVKSMLSLFSVPAKADASSVKQSIQNQLMGSGLVKGGSTTQEASQTGKQNTLQEQFGKLSQIAEQLPTEARERMQFLLQGLKSRTHSQQAASLQSWNDAPDGGIERQYRLDIPVRVSEDRVDNTEIKITQHKRPDSEELYTSEWSINMHFDLEQLGAVDARVSIQQDWQISARFWAEQRNTTEMIRDRLNSFEEQLRGTGFDVDTLLVQQGRQPREEQPAISKRLVDLHT